MYKVYSLLCVFILTGSCFAQHTKWLVEGGTVLASPRLVVESVTNPQNFHASTQNNLKAGFFFNIVNSPNIVFQHVFTFNRVAIGGSHSFAVVANPQSNYPIPTPVTQNFTRMSSQFSYTLRTSIPGFIHKYSETRRDTYSGRWDFLVGLGLGFTINHRESFNQAASYINTRQTITQGAQSGIAASSFDATGNFTMNAPLSAVVTYRLLPRVKIISNYTAILPISFMGVRNNILQSNIYVLNRQEIASLQYTNSLVKHQFSLGVQYQFAQGKK
jgi:hypothetical protein